MDTRTNPTGQLPPESHAVPETPAAPPKHRVSVQYVTIGAVLALSVATTFAMRKYGMGEGLAYKHTQVNLDAATPLVDNAKFGRVMDRLATSNTPMQVPADEIDKNPFRLGRNGPVAVEMPVVNDSAERAARELERQRQEAERRLADLNISFSRLSLNTVITGARPVARINNQIVGVGELVDENFRVVAITNDGVELEADGHAFFLAVNSMVNPRTPTGPRGVAPSSTRGPTRRP